MKFNTLFIKILFSITIFLGCFPLFSTAQITITTDQPDATYQVGETAYFNVSSTTGGLVNYEIFYDGTGFNEIPIPSTIIASGTLNLNTPQQISHQATEAGVVLCRINQNINLTAAAAFSPLEIQPLEEEPTDFDQFWTNAKNELAGIDVAPIVTYHSENDKATFYSVNLGHINNRRVYGFLSVPKGASGKIPAIISLPAFGTSALSPSDGIAASWTGVLHMNISIHNAAPPSTDPNAYQPNDINDPSTFYYKQAILAGVRSIDYLVSRPDCDATKIGVMGESQGGGLAIMVAGIDDRVKLLLSSNPISCENLGIKYNKASGFPKYLQPNWTTQQENSVKYYNAAYFARRYDGPCRFYISYEDLTCPAAGTFSAFNQFSGLKILTHAPEKGHTHVEFFNTRRLFIRQFFNTSNLYLTFKSGTGYYINAGNDITISNGGIASLNGVVQGEDANGNSINLITTYNWTKVSGPGSVTFTTPQGLTTNASFSSSGTYVLQLTVRDDSDSELNNNVDKNFSTLIDKVTITVGNGGNPCDNEGGDSDGDGVCDNQDNCDNTVNPDQADSDNDGIGDACETTQPPSGDCNSVTVVGQSGQVSISNIPSDAKVEISGPSTGWTQQLVCEGNCSSSEIVSSLSAGDYAVTIQTFSPYCYKQHNPIAVTSGSSNRIISSDINQLTEVENIVLKEPTKSAINTSYLDKSSILLYPNPARGTLFINLERASNQKKLIDISIYNLVGQKMMQKKANTSDVKTRFDINSLNNGLYYLSIKEKGKRTITKKFIVEN